MPHPDDSDIRSLLAQILAQLDKATEGLHEIFRTYDRDTPTYREARRGVRTWYKVDSVSLDAPVRQVYNDKFRGGGMPGRWWGGFMGRDGIKEIFSLIIRRVGIVCRRMRGLKLKF